MQTEDRTKKVGEAWDCEYIFLHKWKLLVVWVPASFSSSSAQNKIARYIFHPTESTDSSKENRHGSFTTEAAIEYVESQNEPPSHTPESDAPFDDNLQCLKCGRKYKEGQIQPFRKHMEKCQGN